MSNVTHTNELAPTEAQITTLVSLLERAGIEINTADELWKSRAAVSAEIERLMPTVSRAVADPQESVERVLAARARRHNLT